jgi:hypothetical protein
MKYERIPNIKKSLERKGGGGGEAHRQTAFSCPECCFTLMAETSSNQRFNGRNLYWQKIQQTLPGRVVTFYIILRQTVPMGQSALLNEDLL